MKKKGKDLGKGKKVGGMMPHVAQLDEDPQKCRPYICATTTETQKWRNPQWERDQQESEWRHDPPEHWSPRLEIEPASHRLIGRWMVFPSTVQEQHSRGSSRHGNLAH